MFVELEVMDQATVPQDAQGPLQLTIHRYDGASHPISHDQSSTFNIARELPVQWARMQTEINED